MYNDGGFYNNDYEIHSKTLSNILNKYSMDNKFITITPVSMTFYVDVDECVDDYCMDREIIIRVMPLITVIEDGEDVYEKTKLYTSSQTCVELSYKIGSSYSCMDSFKDCYNDFYNNISNVVESSYELLIPLIEEEDYSNKSVSHYYETQEKYNHSFMLEYKLKKLGL
jgi:hypothetical protein